MVGWFRALPMGLEQHTRSTGSPASDLRALTSRATSVAWFLQSLRFEGSRHDPLGARTVCSSDLGAPGERRLGRVVANRCRLAATRTCSIGSRSAPRGAEHNTWHRGWAIARISQVGETALNPGPSHIHRRYCRGTAWLSNVATFATGLRDRSRPGLCLFRLERLSSACRPTIPGASMTPGAAQSSRIPTKSVGWAKRLTAKRTSVPTRRVTCRRRAVNPGDAIGPNGSGSHEHFAPSLSANCCGARTPVSEQQDRAEPLSANC